MSRSPEYGGYRALLRPLEFPEFFFKGVRRHTRLINHIVVALRGDPCGRRGEWPAYRSIDGETPALSVGEPAEMHLRDVVVLPGYCHGYPHPFILASRAMVHY